MCRCIYDRLNARVSISLLKYLTLCPHGHGGKKSVGVYKLIACSVWCEASTTLDVVHNPCSVVASTCALYQNYIYTIPVGTR